METEDIEKLKEAAFKLAEMIKQRLETDQRFTIETWRRVIAAVEMLKANPEPVECWANVYQDGSCMGFAREDTALLETTPKHVRSAVHLREVTPAPEWERWKVVEIRQRFGLAEGGGKFISTAPTLYTLADAHNAEMKRVTGTEGK